MVAIPSVSYFLRKALGKCELSPGYSLNCAINMQIDYPDKSHFIVILFLLTFYWTTFIVIQLHLLHIYCIPSIEGRNQHAPLTPSSAL